MVRRLARVLLSATLLVALASGGLLAWLAWRPDTARAPLERYLSARLGSPVRIGGPLGLELGRVAVLELRRVSVGAPAWARSPTLATVDRLRLGIDLGASLARRGAVLAELRLDALALERDGQGRTSWPAGRGGGATPPQVRALAVVDGRVTYRDAAAGLELEGAGIGVTPTEGTAGAPPGLALRGTVRGHGGEVGLSLEVGSPFLPHPADAPLPVRGELTTPGARLGLRGEVREPAVLDGLALDLELASDDPRPLLALLGRPVDDVPPGLAATGRLTRDGRVLALRDLRAGWGESRLEGELRYDRAPDRPRLDGELRAPVLDLVALRPLAAGAAPGAPAGRGLVAGLDARLRLGAGLVRLPGLELRDAAGELRLADGRLTLEPARAALAGGELAGRLATGPLDRAFTAELALRSERVDLAPLLAGAAGRLGGELSGTLRGGSVAELLGRSRLQLAGRAEALRLPWLADAGGPSSLAVDARLEPDDQDPLQVTVEGALDGVPLRLEVHGTGPVTAPAGAGLHPATVEARLGQTDVAGELALRLDGPRPAVSGNLRSRHLDLDGLAGLVGTVPDASPGERRPTDSSGHEEPPRRGPGPAAWGRVDLDLALAAERVTADRVPIDGFDLDLALEDGRLRLEPLGLQVGEGRIEGRAALDGGRSPAPGELALTLSRLPVARLFQRAEPLGTLSGRVEARTADGGEGIGARELLDHAEGGVTLVLEGGTINRKLVSAVGLDLPNLLGSLLGGAPEKVELRCALADLALGGGALTTRALVIETPIATIGGEGRLELATGRLELELLAPPGAAPLPGGRSGVRITGTLARPEAAVDRAAVAARGAEAATLGAVLAPFAALASSLGSSGDAPGPCAGLLGHAGKGEGRSGRDSASGGTAPAREATPKGR